MRRLALRWWRQATPRTRGWIVRRIAPKLTLGVCAVALDAHGRILVAHHTYRRWPWGLPGGLLERDEGPTAALARELREECAAEAPIGPLLPAAPFPSHLTLYYQVTLASDPQPDGVEIASFEYVAPDEIVRLLGRAALPWLAQLALLNPPSTLANVS